MRDADNPRARYKTLVTQEGPAGVSHNGADGSLEIGIEAEGVRVVVHLTQEAAVRLFGTCLGFMGATVRGVVLERAERWAAQLEAMRAGLVARINREPGQ